MIEQVARALCGERGRGEYNHSDYVERNWQNHVRFANAAIEAMREPTPEMLTKAVYMDDYIHVGDEEGKNIILRAWQAMIDTALCEDGAK